MGGIFTSRIPPLQRKGDPHQGSIDVPHAPDPSDHFLARVATLVGMTGKVETDLKRQGLLVNLPPKAWLPCQDPALLLLAETA